MGASEHGRGVGAQAVGRGRAGQDGTPTGRFFQESADPLAHQTIEDNCPERFPGCTNKRNPK